MLLKTLFWAWSSWWFLSFLSVRAFLFYHLFHLNKFSLCFDPLYFIHWRFIWIFFSLLIETSISSFHRINIVGVSMSSFEMPSYCVKSNQHCRFFLWVPFNSGKSHFGDSSDYAQKKDCLTTIIKQKPRWAATKEIPTLQSNLSFKNLQAEA